MKIKETPYTKDDIQIIKQLCRNRIRHLMYKKRSSIGSQMLHTLAASMIPGALFTGIICLIPQAETFLQKHTGIHIAVFLFLSVCFLLLQIPGAVQSIHLVNTDAYAEWYQLYDFCTEALTAYEKFDALFKERAHDIIIEEWTNVKIKNCSSESGDSMPTTIYIPEDILKKLVQNNTITFAYYEKELDNIITLLQQ